MTDIHDNVITFLCQRGGRESVKITVSAHSDASTLVEAFRSFMLAVGYDPETVNDALGDPP